MLAAVLALLLPSPGATPPHAAEGGVPAKYAGTYRIDHWRTLEDRGLYHFFYLHPDGHFLLAALWPKRERSQFAGTWSVSDDRLYLNGAGQVKTNQGDWKTEFHRTYRIRVVPRGFELEPEPQKNRYGLMGWPDAYRYFRTQPSPNLPGEDLPDNAEAMGLFIAERLKAAR